MCWIAGLAGWSERERERWRDKDQNNAMRRIKQISAAEKGRQRKRSQERMRPGCPQQ